MACDRRLVLKKIESLVTRHVEDIGNGPPLKSNVESVPVIALPLAHLAGHIHVGQKVHLDSDGPVTRAGLAPTTLDIKAESAGLVATNPRLFSLGEQLSNMIEHPGVSGCVRSWGPSDWGQVDVDDLLHRLNTLQGRIQTWRCLRSVHLLHQSLMKDLVDQSGLA